MYFLSPAEGSPNLCFHELVLWHQVSVLACLDDGTEYELTAGEVSNEFVLGDQLSAFALKVLAICPGFALTI